MEDLLFNQNELINAIKKLGVNFNKDGAERKSSSDYFKRKLVTLESYWKEFENNHVELSRYDIRDEQYYINNDYEKAMSIFKNLKASIHKQLEVFLARGKSPLTQREGEVTPQPGFSKQEVPSADTIGDSEQQMESGSRSGGQLSQQQVSRGVTSKLDDMLRKQYINFKAFSRTVASIDLEIINEKWEFDDILKSLGSRWSTIDSLHWEIEVELDGEDSSYQGVYNMHEETFAYWKKAINKKMWAVSHREKCTPVLDIPTFAGTYNQWTSFKDLFCEAVHNNPSLPSAQKMQLLKSKLKGEAESLIRHIPVSSENYAICWDILNNRYNNKKLIFSSYLNQLLNFPNIPHQSMNHIKKLHDVIQENIHAIKNLGLDISTWDPILVHILSQKLDSDSHSDYIQSLKNPRDLPELKHFIEFLEFKFTSLEASRRKPETFLPKQYVIKSNYNNNFKTSNQQYNYSKKKQFYASYNNNVTKSLPKPSCNTYGIKCLHCKNTDHLIYECKNFINMPRDLKLKTVKQLNICENCLFDHNGKQCFSRKTCRNCKCRHHTLLCMQTQPSTSVPVATSQVTGTNHVSQGDESEVLLATALIQVTAADGSKQVLRALIDQGSQISLISENAAQLLGIKRRCCSGVIFGVGEKQSSSKGVINIECASIYGGFTFNTDVLIINNLIKNLPTQTFSKPTWSHISNIQLADPEFFISRRVDLLFGADIYSRIMLSSILKSDDKSQPIAQQTHLGWILCGNMRKTFQCNVVLNNIDDIKQFWELEDIEDDTNLSSEDQECVQFYKTTTNRRADGRYVVRLPIQKDKLHTLGLSRNIAIAQFINLENKLSKRNELYSQYKAFMCEYKDLNHMQECSKIDINSQDCYLPHHCVQQQSKGDVSKFRVVFNASSKTSTGISLNDVMLRGPNLQRDLQSLILKWRQYQFVVTADIEKMYRQILVHEDDQPFQKIIWRDSVTEPIKSYQLATVTYGLKAAPFLAMMTLQQLAEDESEMFPIASKILKQDFYMDDLLTGFHSISEGKNLVSKLDQLLKSAGFTLRKWASNTQELFQHSEESQTRDNFQFNFKSECTKTLGLKWNAQEDNFTFNHNLNENFSLRPTKRILLSEISKIFDPLGWLSPVVTSLKILFQNIWKANLGWDDTVSEHIYSEWLKLRKDLDNIRNIKVPRWIGSCDNDSIQLHGFCDSSIKAYACVLYARIHKNGESKIVLVAAKSKLVPYMKNITLPRLELCGAQLLAKLMHKVLQNLASYKIEIYAWCDSKVVLGWLHGEPGRWKPFVSNRVKLIIPIISAQSWGYVKSAENPADSASRGQLAINLQSNELWWQGPSWLRTFEHVKQPELFTTNEEIRAKQANVTCINHTEPDIIYELLNKFNSFKKINAILAWILRAMNPKRKQCPSYLTLQELHKAKILIIRRVQMNEFNQDINYFKKHNMVRSNSKILNLNPFIDEDGILKVGGRLEKSSLKLEVKHPIILPHDCRLTTLLIEEAHQCTFHGGPRLTITWLRQKYWIIGGIRAVKKQVRKCVTCRKYNPLHQHQLMGTLPESRTKQAAPFFHTGVDLTGFVDVKANFGRGIKTTKGYIVLFICMVTKAVHLELVSDLSSSAFLAALKRMAARRGAPHHVYSDNGTNFIKANRSLQEEYFSLQGIIDNKFMKETSDMNIEWHFQAPSWPSASGLWERAIRSLKSHLKPVIGEQKLTIEEYSTLLAQIEACLNTRPLCALTEDPEDLNVLTPAHFLTCRADLTILETEKDARTRWQLLSKLAKDIWRRWKTEYLTELTVRSKWLKKQENIKVGDIVCIKDENLPPGKWAIGRVVELHPGSDGIVRVVSLKTKNGYMKRPVLKLSLLPIQQYGNENQSHSSKQVVASTVVTTTKKTKSKNILTTLISIILFMNIFTTVQCDFHIREFNQTQGIYFDKISNLQVIRDQWKLVVYYDLNFFWESSSALQKYIKQLDLTCSKIDDVSQCSLLLTQLRHGYSELNYYSQILLTQHDSTRNRQRRGLINGVGYLSNYLFGVLDERFAEQYQQDIKSIKDNEKYISTLWKNQTSIVEAEYNLLKRTEKTMSDQYKTIQENIRILHKATDTLETEINKNSLQNDFTLGALTAASILQNLKEIQNMLLDQITDIYHGRFNFHILTPEQFLNELSIISAQLPSELSLPIHNIHSDIRKIYSLLKIKTRTLKEYVLFEIRIPLISREIYDLYHMIPIPRPIGNNLTINFITKSKYVAINIHKDTYILTSEYEIRDCVRQEADTHICYLRAPVYQLRGDYDLCEKDDKARTCRTNIGQCNNMWINLNKDNSYLYFCCDQCTARILCKDQVSSYRLTRAGIAIVSDDCIIKMDKFIIYSHKERTNDLYIRPEGLVTDIPSINHLLNLSIPLLELNDTDANSRKNDLIEIGHSIQQIKEQAQLSEVTVHDIHHYAVIYFLLSVVSIAAAILLWKRIRRFVRLALSLGEIGASLVLIVRVKV